MKRRVYKKKTTIFFYLGLIIISAFYLFLRLWNFPKLFTFQLDQGVHFSEARQMVTSGNLRLIGPMVSSKIYDGRGFFIGANYYYLLALLGLITGWQPIAISIISLLMIFLSILFFVIWLRKRMGEIPALICFSLIASMNYFVVHSRFFWNPHFLIPIGIFLVVFLEKFYREGKLFDLFLVGFFWGNGISFHYSALLWMLPIMLVLAVKNEGRRKLFWSVLLLAGGAVLGNLPFVIFELKHNFYNLRTMIFIFFDSKNIVSISFHSFVFSGFAFVFYVLSLLLKTFLKARRKAAIFTSILLVVIFGSLIDLDRQWPEGTSKGWNWPVQNRVVDLIIANGCPKNFNIASTLNGDTRSYDLRFLLEREGCLPMKVDQYPQTERLFLVADTNRYPEEEKVWEVDSLRPFVINKEVVLNDYAKFYELDRID